MCVPKRVVCPMSTFLCVFPLLRLLINGNIQCELTCSKARAKIQGLSLKNGVDIWTFVRKNE